MPSLASRISSNLSNKKTNKLLNTYPKDADVFRFDRDSPADALVVLQLADDLDVLALLAQHFPDSMNVSCLTDEGGEDHVNTLLHTELQVLNVLLRHSGEIDSSSGQVDALLAAQHTAILNLTHEIVRADFFDLQGNQTIVNVDVASNLHNLGDVLVVKPQNFLIAVVNVLVVEGELDGLTLLQLDLSGATLNKGGHFVSSTSLQEKPFIQLFVR